MPSRCATYTGRTSTRFRAWDVCEDFPLARAVGVEIELVDTESPRVDQEQWMSAGSRRVGTAIDRACARWSAAIDGDGSLPSGGIEIRTQPASGHAVCAQLREIGEAVRIVGAHATPACGLHVHVDMRDANAATVYRLCKAWYVLEPLLFRYVAKHRRVGRRGDGVNSYCQPSVDNSDSPLRQTIARCERYIREQALGVDLLRQYSPGDVIVGHDRYYGLNLTAYNTHNTVEFRLHQGSSDWQQIRDWAGLCAAIVQFAHDGFDVITPDPDALLEAILSRHGTLGRNFMRRYQRREYMRSYSALRMYNPEERNRVRLQAAESVGNAIAACEPCVATEPERYLRTRAVFGRYRRVTVERAPRRVPSLLERETAVLSVAASIAPQSPAGWASV